jgi:dipeptidyl aminopeptidase/acylaminoacyl peptidase
MAVRTRHGEWGSPFTAASVAAGAGGPSWPAVVGAETWWCASRTATASTGLLRCGVPGGPVTDVLGDGWTVTNSAIGYGGRPYLVVPGATRHQLVFTHGGDRRLYTAQVAALDGGAQPRPEPRPLTPEDPEGVKTCYADPILGPGGTEVWCIRETARLAASAGLDPADATARDIIAVPISGAAAEDPAAVRVVARSHHFLSGIRLSPDGTRLAWIGWNHPDMPWDTSDLMVARIAEGRAPDPVRVLGGAGVSVPQAEWESADTLYAMADPDGWWNLHRVTLDASDAEKTEENEKSGKAERAGKIEETAKVGNAGKAECVLPMESEFGHPIWRVGATSFAVTQAGVLLRHGVGEQRLVLWDPSSGALTGLAGEWTEFSIGLHASADAAAVIAASGTERSTPVRISLPSGKAERCEARTDAHLDPWHARPERRTAPGPDGRLVHYVLYPPTNPDHQGPGGELPPLIIDVHGGPTSATGAARTLTFSLLCSLGFAVASVDHGGSTGYGRGYRDLLRHQWGIVDVQDCVTVAGALAEAGLADPARIAIRGGSAGGWTTLAALAHTDVFCCGAVYYPISDPSTWFGAQTHDFESRYISSLVGELPRDQEHFQRVSPLAAAENITVPFVMMQGLDDGICRPDQADRVVQAVEAAHGPDLCHAYLRFPGEGHGFREAASIRASLEAELALYRQVMVLC